MFRTVWFTDRPGLESWQLREGIMEEKAVEMRSFPFILGFQSERTTRQKHRFCCLKLLDKAQYYSCFVGRLSASSLANALQLAPRQQSLAHLTHARLSGFGSRQFNSDFYWCSYFMLVAALESSTPETVRPFEYMARASARPSIGGQYPSLFFEDRTVK